MSGEAYEARDPRRGPVSEALAGPKPSTPVSGGRPNVVTELLRRCVAAVFCATRRAVAWCAGRPWAGSDLAPGPGRSGPDRGTGPLLTGDAGVSLDSARLIREVRRLLAGLGPTPGDVAASLEAVGVHGLPHDPGRSPLGAFLSAVVAADADVEALSLRTDAVGISVRGSRSQVTVPFPGPVRAFVSAFDAQCYPMLDDRTRVRRPER